MRGRSGHGLRATGYGSEPRAEPSVTPAPSRIRAGLPADAPACAAVMRAAVRAISPSVHPPAALAAWSSLPALYHRWAMGPGGETYLVAARAGGLLGYAALRGAELTAVFVRPGAQGQGLGRALVAAAASAARRRGHRALRVVAARAAVPFYAALGFRGARPARAPLPGGLALAAVRMRLPLASPRAPQAGRPRRAARPARAPERP